MYRRTSNRKPSIVDYWQGEADNTLLLKPEKQPCSKCKKLKLLGNHVDAFNWMCNGCLKARAKKINQSLLAVPSFMAGLPPLGSTKQKKPKKQK